MTHEEKMMKALALLNEFKALGTIYMHPAIGMMIDTCAHMEGRDPVEFTEELLEAVKIVNDAMGMEGIA